MTAFPERSRALRGVVLDRRSRDDGGWPHRLDVANAASSIVATAHAIEMVRMWNHEYDDPAVQSGLAYLADSVGKHTAPRSVKGPGRGELSRYPAYALWGLTRYRRAAFDPAYRAGVVFSLRWLNKNALKHGGWAAGESDELSFTFTSPVVHALDRISFHPTYGKLARRLAASGRRAVVRAARHSGEQAWWTPYGDSAPPSAGATALAVLTLAAGDDSQRELARRGISWLLTNPREWVEETEPDMHVGDRSWQIMSFSLGLRAVLHPCAHVPPSERILRPVIHFFDDLWVEQEGAWSHYPGGIASTTGSFSVVTAVRALKRAFEFDPVTHLRTGRSRRKGGAKLRMPRPRLTLELTPRNAGVRVTNQHGERVVACRVPGTSQWKVLEIVARRHLEAKDKNDQMAQTISVAEIATQAEITGQAALKAISRVNALLSDRADEMNQFLPALIEDIDPSGSTERRYGLEELDVVIAEDAET